MRHRRLQVEHAGKKQKQRANLDAQDFILKVQVERAKPVNITLPQQLLHLTLQVWLAAGQP
jgi:hypothetical protein